MAENDDPTTAADEGEQSKSNGKGGNSLLSSLMSKDLLLPAVLSAAGAVAAAKGPDLVRRFADKTDEKGQEEAEKLGRKGAEGAKNALTGGATSGGIGSAAAKAVSKALPGGGGGRGKKTRRLPIQRWTDVALPVEKTFEAWTKFDEYPKFMHRVLSVRQEGDDKVRWQEKIWFSKREWEAEITDRRENDRIAWKTTSGTTHSGIVSFHRLDDNLTRVMVTLNFEPTGMFEKMASGLRFAKRAVQADLARFKAHVELKDAKGLDYDAGRSDGDEREGKKRVGRANGSGRSASRRAASAESTDDGDRDDERREREQRREERRAGAAR
jgi:uncharacterized membrane protein